MTSGIAHRSSVWEPVGRTSPKAFIGLDIGGSKVAAALLDERASAITFDASPWPGASGLDALLQTADRLVANLISRAGEAARPVLGLGIAVPELVDLDGRIASADVIPGLATCDLAGRWLDPKRVVVESDVRAGAVGEARRGAARGFESFAYVSVGTGISYCLVQAGAPWTGAHGGAILLGSGPMAELDGVPWILEQIASGPALLAHHRQLGGREVSVAELLAAYGDDETARKAVDRGAHALGIGIASLLNLLDPAMVVVGGGLGSAPGPFWEQSLKSAREHICWKGARETPIVQAKLGSRSGAIGAALISFSEHVD